MVRGTISDELGTEESNEGRWNKISKKEGKYDDIKISLD